MKKVFFLFLMVGVIFSFIGSAKGLDIPSLEQKANNGDMVAIKQLIEIYKDKETKAEGKFDKLLYWLEKAADQNDKQSIFFIYRMVKDGFVSRYAYQDKLEKWSINLASDGEEDALDQYFLAWEYYGGDIIKYNPDLAKEYIKLALMDENLDSEKKESLEVLAEFLENPNLEERYRQNAFKAEQKAQQTKDPNDIYRAGSVLLSQFRAYDGIRYIQEAAEKGHAGAQQELAMAYRYGQHSKEKDMLRAVFWYELAAAQGEEFALKELAYIYEGNSEVPADFTKSAIYYEQLAEQGDKEAQYKLGVFYAVGRGLEKDQEKSIYWYEKAAEQGHGDAKKRLKTMKK